MRQILMSKRDEFDYSESRKVFTSLAIRMLAKIVNEKNEHDEAVVVLHRQPKEPEGK